MANNSLQKQPGFIGGDVWQREKDSNNYLVLTYWSSEQAYRAYEIGVFAELTQLIEQQNIAQVPTKKASAKKVTSKTVLVERRWDVIAHK